MIQISVGGLAAFFDDADSALAHNWRWHLHPTRHRVYLRGYPIGNRRSGLRYAHRVLTGAGQGCDVDHKDGDGLNNRRSNLRLCSRTLNSANRFITQGVSGVKGVHFDKTTGRWRADVQMFGVRYRLGRFDTVAEAAAAYEAKAKELFGEFANPGHRTNSK